MNISYHEVTDILEKADSIALRWRVFVAEQNVLPAEEVENDDLELPFYEARDGDKVIATGRLRFKENGNLAKLERIVTDKNYRGKGIGKDLILFMLTKAKEVGAENAMLESQIQAMPFYNKLGFEAYGHEFLDARIPHKKMKKTL